jgi:hypothetical protein
MSRTEVMWIGTLKRLSTEEEIIIIFFFRLHRFDKIADQQPLVKKVRLPFCSWGSWEASKYISQEGKQISVFKLENLVDVLFPFDPGVFQANYRNRNPI